MSSQVVIVSFVIAAYRRLTEQCCALACGECLEVVSSHHIVLCIICGNLS